TSPATICAPVPWWRCCKPTVHRRTRSASCTRASGTCRHGYAASSTCWWPVGGRACPGNTDWGKAGPYAGPEPGFIAGGAAGKLATTDNPSGDPMTALSVLDLVMIGEGKTFADAIEESRQL